LTELALEGDEEASNVTTQPKKAAQATSETPPKENSKNILNLQNQDAKPRARLLAELGLSAVLANTTTTRAFAKAAAGEVDITEAFAVMKEKTRAVQAGNLAGLEETLTAQAMALNAIFNEMARRTAANMGEYINAAEIYLRLGLKAQAQCRATVQTLFEMKNPQPVAFVKQANIANGPRVFRDFRYRTIDSWSQTRRVVGKAEHTLDGSNPRFVVTSLKCTRVAYDARALYEDLYCARGEAENRIGEQFEMFADRASSATMTANQLRMSFSAMAYVLVDTLRRVALRHSQFADASAQTIRLKLLKLGAQVRTSVRRIHFAIASGCPNKAEFALAHIYLRRAFSSA
jgi:hypothetical protein